MYYNLFCIFIVKITNYDKISNKAFFYLYKIKTQSCFIPRFYFIFLICFVFYFFLLSFQLENFLFFKLYLSYLLIRFHQYYGTNYFSFKK